MKELQQRPTQTQRPVRYYIVKTEHDDQPVVRSVPVSRVAPPPSVVPAAPVQAVAAIPPESERDRTPDRRRDRGGVGRLVRAAASISRGRSSR